MAVQEQIYVNTAKGHNKYWIVGIDSDRPQWLLVRSGRLGTRGITQPPLDCGGAALAEHQRWSRAHEKTRKGYRLVSARELQQLHTQAAIAGSGNKCSTPQWLEQLPRAAGSDELECRPADPDRLAHPDCVPLMVVELETRKDYDGRTRFLLLFDTSGCSEGVWLTSRRIGRIQPITPAHPLYQVASLAGQSLSVYFGG